MFQGFEESWTTRKSASRFAGPMTVSFIGVSAGADVGICPARPRTARSGKLNALFPGEQKPGFWPRVLVCHDLGFTTKIGFGNDDFIARARRNRREDFRLGNKGCARRAVTLRGKSEEPDLFSRFDDSTRGSGGTLRGIHRGEVFEAPN